MAALEGMKRVKPLGMPSGMTPSTAAAEHEDEGQPWQAEATEP